LVESWYLEVVFVVDYFNYPTLFLHLLHLEDIIEIELEVKIIEDLLIDDFRNINHQLCKFILVLRNIGVLL